MEPGFMCLLISHNTFEKKISNMCIVIPNKWNHYVIPLFDNLFYFVINSAFPPAFSIAS